MRIRVWGFDPEEGLRNARPGRDRDVDRLAEVFQRSRDDPSRRHFRFGSEDARLLANPYDDLWEKWWIEDNYHRVREEVRREMENERRGAGNGSGNCNGSGHGNGNGNAGGNGKTNDNGNGGGNGNGSDRWD